MKDKILISIIIILLLALFIETAYLLQLKFDKSYKMLTYNKPFFHRPFIREWNYDPFRMHEDFDRFDPLDEMENFHKKMDELLKDTFILRHTFPNNDRFFNPDAKIEETDKHYIVKMYLPEMEEEKINVEIEEDSLIISGNHEASQTKTSKNGFYKKEQHFGSFKKIIPIPQDIKVDKVITEYNDGLLIVKIPKASSNKNITSKPKSNIQI